MTPAIISPAFHCVQSSKPGQARHACPGTRRKTPHRRALRSVLLAQTDCEKLRSVVLALDQEPLETSG